MKVRKRYFGVLMFLLVSGLLIFRCTPEAPEPEMPRQRTLRKVNVEDIPEVTRALHEKLGLTRSNHRLNVSRQDREVDLNIDWNYIMERIDSAGKVNYTFALEDPEEDPYTFHNLIIGKTVEGIFQRPYLLTYRMSEAFKPVYQATGSLSGFTGTVLKRYFSDFTFSTPRGSSSDPDDTGPDAGGDPCDREITVGSSKDVPPPSGQEPPENELGTGSYCYGYWVDFPSESCGPGCVTAERSVFVIVCVENTSRSSDTDPCPGETEEVAVVKPCKTSKDDLKKVFPNTSDAQLKKVADAINKYAGDFGIDTKEKLQHFLSQAGHESADFTKFKENLNYRIANLGVKNFKRYFNPASDPTKNPNKANPNDYKRTDKPAFAKPKELANLVYSDRMGNGDTASGDGYKYRGRGIFQLTGKYNYQQFTAFYKKTYDKTKDFVTNPDLIATDTDIAIVSALWHYKKYVLDKLTVDDKTSADVVSEKVNGGENGIKERKELFNKAKDKITCK